MLVQEDGAGDLVGCAEGLEHGERAVLLRLHKSVRFSLSTKAVVEPRLRGVKCFSNCPYQLTLTKFRCWLSWAIRFVPIQMSLLSLLDIRLIFINLPSIPCGADLSSAGENRRRC